MTAMMVRVLNRPIKPIQLRFHKLFGCQFECIVPPSAPVEGLVTDADSGKPIPGVRIFNEVNHPGAYLSTTTDARGHYRIEGLETGSFYEVTIRVSDLPYFGKT